MKRSANTAGPSVLALALALCGALSPAGAQEAKSGEDESRLREKTVYVPYDKLSEVFEKEGRGIFLPYREFLEIWRRAQAPPKPPVDLPPPADAVLTGGRYRGEVAGDLARLDVTYVVEALREKGWSVLPLELNGVAVESAEISRSGQEPAPASAPPLFVGEAGKYRALFPSAGNYEIRLKIAVRVQSRPGQRSLGFQIPAAAVSVLDLTIPEENPQIDVEPQTVASEVKVEGGETKVVAFLGNATQVGVSWSPRVEARVEEEALLVASQKIHAYLGERVLRMNCAVTLSILSREIARIRVQVPDGLQVLRIDGENIRTYVTPKDDSNILELQLHSAVKESYAFRIAFERILDQTPDSLEVTFPRVEGVLRESGYVAFAYDSSLRVRVTAAEGLGQRDLEEIPEDLRGGAQVGFRYLAHPLRLAVSVVPILPVVHAASTSVVVFGVEQDQWIGWIDYRITRAGIFALELEVPDRWIVDALGDDATVEDHERADADGNAAFDRISVNLKSRAFGAFRLPFRFTAPGSAAATDARDVHAPRTVGASIESDRGLIGIAAPREFKVNEDEAGRQGVSAVAAQKLFASGILSRVPQDVDADWAFEIQEQPARVRVSLEAKTAELKVTPRLLVNVRENVVQFSQALEYRILYAEFGRLSFSAPSALERTLRVEGPDVRDSSFETREGGRSVWTVTLQSKTRNIVTLQLSFEQELSGDANQTIEIPLIRPESVEGAEVRTEDGVIAVRKEGSLEIAVESSDNLQTIDLRELPAELSRGQILLAYRFVQPNYKLSLKLERRTMAEMPHAMVRLMEVHAQLSEEKLLSCAAAMLVRNSKLQSLDVRLPAGANFLASTVNGQRVQPARVGNGSTDDSLLSLPLKAAGHQQEFVVRVDYRVNAGEAMGAMGRFEVVLPRLESSGPSIPVGKVELNLFLPHDYVYVGRSGDLHFRHRGVLDPWAGVKRELWAGLGVQPDVAGATASSAGRQSLLANSPLTIPLELLRDGRHFAFDGYTDAGKVSLSYYGMRLFRILWITVLGLALAAGIVVWKLRPRDAWWWIGGGTALALLVSWSLADQRADFPMAAFIAGSALIALRLLRLGWTRAEAAYARWQDERLKLAPDPFLEDAPASPSSTPSGPGASASPEDDAPPDAGDAVPDAAAEPESPPTVRKPTTRKKKPDEGEVE